KLLIQFSASLSLQLDITIERILADRDTEFQLQASTDDFRRGVDGKLFPDESLNVCKPAARSAAVENRSHICISVNTIWM
ncbi:hypothetical protein, partial [Candidatus Erwinia dacicola]|uniref:hypothetical protein n=1 Tax=Candidatus Erwinia dacicola TaxID=252393 RepID=UPI001C9D143C